jgi:hypothetical protein
VLGRDGLMSYDQGKRAKERTAEPDTSPMQLFPV